MLGMEQVNEIRRMAASGYRQSEISRATGYDAKTVRKYLGIEDYSPKVPVERHGESKLDEYKPTIDKWLDEDERNWRKQRHTAKKVYERLRDEHGCEASYSVVQRYMKGRREGRRSKANLELQWEAGSAQVDFGEADFNEAGCKERRKYLTVSFPYSNTGIPQVFGGETSECVCEGLDAVFWKLGGVPPRIVFDNATGVGRRMGEVIRKAKLFEQFQAHYRFEARFCNPYAGYEKGNVENKVGYIRSNLFVPIPSYESMEEYNLWLLDVMDGKAGEAHYKKHRLIGELFKDDVASLHALPGKRFNVCRYTHMRTDGYGKVCLDGKHHYSTRPELAVSEVIVGIRAHTVEILTVKGEHVVTHRRNYGSLRTDTLDHSTSVAQLMRSAGA